MSNKLSVHISWATSFKVYEHKVELATSAIQKLKKCYFKQTTPILRTKFAFDIARPIYMPATYELEIISADCKSV